jgi:histidine decarboxylase
MNKTYNPIKIIFNSQSEYDLNCEGYHGDSKEYLLALNVAVSTVPKTLSHAGSSTLDQINAFDLAEVNDVNIGQINMMQVSSFCGPMGAVLGYDFLRSKTDYQLLETISYKDKQLALFDGTGLLQAARTLFGTVQDVRSPLKPGVHSFCATKSLKVVGPAHIYAAIGIGIPKDRSKNACLMMEDVGTIPLEVTNIEEYTKNILSLIGKSIIQVGINQQVEYETAFVLIKKQRVADNEVGCALAASPYFKIASNALSQYTEEQLMHISFQDWEHKLFNLRSK